MNELTVEYRKQKHMFIWLIPLVFLAVIFLWSTAGQGGLSDNDLAQGYSYLLYLMPVLNCILMPVMLAVLSSRICDMEVKGGTWKLLFTLQEKSRFYDRKFLTEFLYLALFCVGELTVLLLCGMLLGYTEPLPVKQALLHLAATLLTGSAVLTLQHILSLLAANQFVPLLTGLAGSFLGLFSEFFPPALARLVLWGYFGAFTPYHMDWNNDAQKIILIHKSFPTGLFAGLFGFTVLSYLLCRHIFLKKEL